jgi:hypothetical protein
MNTKKDPPAFLPVSTNDITCAVRDEILNRVERDYEEFKKIHTFSFLTWLYGPP